MVLRAQAAGLLLGDVRAPVAAPAPTLARRHARVALIAAPILALGLDPEVVPLVVLSFLGGCGMELSGIGWQTAQRERVPARLLSQGSCSNALGSFVAVPAGAVVFGPLVLLAVSSSGV
jgi:hypothetical protein